MGERSTRGKPSLASTYTSRFQSWSSLARTLDDVCTSTLEFLAVYLCFSRNKPWLIFKRFTRIGSIFDVAQRAQEELENECRGRTRHERARRENGRNIGDHGEGTASVAFVRRKGFSRFLSRIDSKSTRLYTPRRLATTSIRRSFTRRTRLAIFSSSRSSADSRRTHSTTAHTCVARSLSSASVSSPFSCPILSSSIFLSSPLSPRSSHSSHPHPETSDRSTESPAEWFRHPFCYRLEQRISTFNRSIWD